MRADRVNCDAQQYLWQAKTKFVCPACDRQSLNRRHGKCDFCGKELPASMLLSPPQLAFLEEEDRKVEKIRSNLAKQAAEESRKKQVRRGDGG